MAQKQPLLLRRQLRTEGDTVVLAKEIAPALRPGDILALQGTLGAGKSAFARALINALPGDLEDVPSPTFTLVQTYSRGDVEVWHFDLYRLEQPEEAMELGIEDAFFEAISLIEWPEKLGPYLPARHLCINLAQQNNSNVRTIELYGDTKWRTRLSEFLKLDKDID